MFNFEHLSHVGGSSPCPRIYTYNTDDIRSVVLGAGYFNSLYLKAQVKDLIIVNNTDEVYTCKVTAVSKNLVTVEKTSLSRNEYAHYYLSAELDLTLNSDGVTYSVITGMALGLSNSFSLSDGVLTYSGVGGIFSFIGSSSVSTNKIADLTMTLEINGTPSTVSMTDAHQGGNKRQSTSSNGIFQISNGDEFRVLMRGDGQSGLDATIYTMNLNFVEL